ncbi:hypothetical protein [Mycobacterium hubeiense]|uniref:hypothetical protein n=1 Tax=Mycobacterium hubeiense TaxID=1867256 RepID=UPI0018EC3817|nr:hypothetical protein [Mycobacterium sp. QGD 101]
MSVATRVQPVWAHDAFLRSFWVATGESPEWIASRTDALLNALGPVVGVTAWTTHTGDRWEGPPDDLAEIVRRFVVRDRPTASSPEGEPMPEEGYSFVVSGSGTKVDVEVRVTAGSQVLAARLPMHTLSIKLREKVPGGITGDLGDAVCAAVASTWRPSNLKLTDSATNSTARRGGWKIGVGYRTWISSEVGKVDHVAEGLTVTELAGGTMISAPDDWPAQRVVEAMTATLVANGLDEVAH